MLLLWHQPNLPLPPSPVADTEHSTAGSSTYVRFLNQSKLCHLLTLPCRSVLDLLVDLGGNKATTLRITLPAHFPQVCVPASLCMCWSVCLCACLLGVKMCVLLRGVMSPLQNKPAALRMTAISTGTGSSVTERTALTD